MKVLVAIAVDDGEGVAQAVGWNGTHDRAEREEHAIDELTANGFVAARVVWVEVDVPAPPDTIRVTAQEAL